MKNHNLLISAVVYRSLAISLMVAGCAGADETAETEAASQAPEEFSQLPAAILGQAGDPLGETVQYWGADPSTVGYLAQPEGDGPFPAVILIHEWNGLVDRVRQVADEMAAQGYVALAADLYQGRVGESADENRQLVGETQADPQRVIDNLNAAAAFLRARGDVTGKLATMGWCFGGGVALSYAIGGEHHDGTAIFYGSLVTDPERLQAIDHPVYGTFAENDRGIPPEQVSEFAEALRSIGIENDIHVYDAVNHGFWLRVDGDPELRTEPATDAWHRLQAYLRQTLIDD